LSRTEYYCATSLDGYIADDDDDIDWLTGYQGSYDGPDAVPMKGTYDTFFENVGALVMGSSTYEWLLGHEASEEGSWPYVGDPTWVLSSRELPNPETPGADVRFASGSVADLAPEMFEAAGEKALWIVGGGTVASQFAEAELLDRVILTVVPVVLGSGKPLFEDALAQNPMQLTGTRAFDTGMVELVYDVRK
jgi:dihydrofolate reductase